jgi:hypothetical protein
VEEREDFLKMKLLFVVSWQNSNLGRLVTAVLISEWENAAGMGVGGNEQSVSEVVKISVSCRSRTACWLIQRWVNRGLAQYLLKHYQRVESSFHFIRLILILLLSLSNSPSLSFSFIYIIY